MPRFHFNTADHQDDSGTELPSLAVAKCEAIKLAGRIVCDVADKFWDDAEWCLTVTDDQHLTLFQLQIIGTEAPAIVASSSSRAA